MDRDTMDFVDTPPGVDDPEELEALTLALTDDQHIFATRLGWGVSSTS